MTRCVTGLAGPAGASTVAMNPSLTTEKLRQLVRAEPENLAAWQQLGMRCLGQGELDEAIVALSRVLEIRPQFPEALNNLGVVHARNRQPDGGLRASGAPRFTGRGSCD